MFWRILALNLPPKSRKMPPAAFKQSEEAASGCGIVVGQPRRLGAGRARARSNLDSTDHPFGEWNGKGA